MKTQLTLPEFVPASINIHIIGICLVFITACSVFKEKSFFRANSLSRNKIDHSVKTKANFQSQAIRISTGAASSDQQSYTEIFPEGSFRYSPSEGYTGKAVKMIVKQRIQQVRRSKDSSLVSHAGNLTTESKASEKSEVKTSQKNRLLKPKNLTMIYVSGCILVFFMVCLLWRFFKKT